MASPQKEHGYTQIANELYDALIRFRIPGEARQVLDFIIRKTYGFHKKEDAISLSQFCAATGLKRGNVCRDINLLIHSKLIIKNDTSKISKYKFNKDFTQWQPLSKVRLGKNIHKQSTEVLSKVRLPSLRSDNRGPQKIREILTKRYQK